MVIFWKIFTFLLILGSKVLSCSPIRPRSKIQAFLAGFKRDYGWMPYKAPTTRNTGPFAMKTLIATKTEYFSKMFWIGRLDLINRERNPASGATVHSHRLQNIVVLQ